jgi:DNA-binding NarL/FixJ family response regulator
MFFSGVVMADVKTVFVAAKYPIVRLGIVNVIENSKFYKVESEHGCVEAELVLRSNHDAAILAFENYYALEMIKKLRRGGCKRPVLILGDENDRHIAQALFKSGGNGLVCKSEPTDGLIHALDTVFKRGFYISDALPRQLVGNHRDTDILTDREREILVLIGNGDSNAEIAKKLDMAQKTVDSHISHICKKLQLSNYHKLIHWATKWLIHTGVTSLGVAPMSS